MITVYTKEGCPKCKILKMKLTEKNIPYTECQDVKKMIDMGFKSAPVMFVDDDYYSFSEAIQYVKGLPGV